MAGSSKGWKVMVDKPEVSESALQTLAIAGDAQAFGKLIRTYDHDLRGAVYNITRSANDLDDIMQKSYEKAFKSVSNFNARSSMKTWLYTICTRQAIDHLRYEGRRDHDEIDGSHDSTEGSNSPESATLSKMACDEVLQDLDPETRAMLVFTTALGFSFDETAEIMESQRGTVASKVGRAKKKLRDRYSQAGEDS